MRQFNLTLSLAFLAPLLVKAAVDIERLRHPDPNWAKQFHDLGLNQTESWGCSGVSERTT